MSETDLLSGLRRQHEQLESIKGILVGLDRKARQRGDGPSPATMLARTLATQLLAQIAGETDVLAFGEKLFGMPIERMPHAFARSLIHGAGQIFKTAVAPAQTTVAGNAAELMQSVNFTGVLPSLAPKAVYSSLVARGGPRVVVSGNGGVRFPARAPGSLAGGFVLEAAPIKIGRGNFTTSTLAPKKLALISTLTEEAGLFSIPALTSVIQQAIAEDTAAALDSYLLDAVAASATRPAGLLAGLSSLTPTPIANGPLNALAGDVGLLAGAIPQASDFVILMNAAERARAIVLAPALAGLVVEAPSLPSKRIVGLDCADLCSAESDTPRFSISIEATIHEEDTTPLPIGTPGAPATVAAPARSLFQTDSAAIRMVLYVSWMMRRSGRAAFIDGVLW